MKNDIQQLKEHRVAILIIGKDGNAPFCHDETFENIQESDICFGETYLDAINQFLTLKGLPNANT